ncbi:uncharacterized protein LOC103572248 isoform X1 [Microplitis demolitor]|uniref:uncharacterized protein LOC103572248 isoform X1 n=1 Tax=Microplitis demolitor TaxID=69319 RepID=UPI0004CD710B|nr:uncharacterized protein LOC103572248 isoform X1 [Microplitis demolitor]XP_053594533.1 uncharacterized protein LOC103572248 isoform X1 [Microplitis demolitor]XP_053594534.1 uncharacterized protein LOC103572248 isoform X1 [Microplitis demolitor]XP_053594535.1 uncharacterized protein LOC103572248 isoform X1 [Microplitis demolitor]
MKPVKIPGLFPNTWRYVFGEFTFHKIKGLKKPTYKCTYKRAYENCNVTITKEGGKYIQRVPKHNHPAPPNSKLKQSLGKKLENLATTSHLSSNEIINVLRESAEQSEVRRGAMKTRVSRTRKKALPKVPEYFHQLKDIVRKYSKTSCIYRGQIEAEDGSLAIMLSTSELIKLMGDCNEIQIDGVYESVPVEPSMAQLLIFYLRRNNIGLPCLFILCNSTTEALYSAIFKGLVERIPTMKQNLKSIFCDFEPAFIAAAKKSFDNVKLQGTWFNYIRVASRLWRTLNLKDNLKHDILRYSWLIPLLPPNRYEEAFNEITATIQDTNEIYDESEEDLISFIRCLKGLIGSKPEATSYYNNHQNAINVAENFNRHIANNLGGYNPNLFTYLERIRRNCIDSHEKWMKLENGIELIQFQRNRYIFVNGHIIEQLTRLDSGELSMIDFFKNAATATMIDEILHQLQIVQYRGDDRKSKIPVDILLASEDGNQLSNLQL